MHLGHGATPYAHFAIATVATRARGCVRGLDDGTRELVELIDSDVARLLEKAEYARVQVVQAKGDGFGSNVRVDGELNEDCMRPQVSNCWM